MSGATPEVVVLHRDDWFLVLCKPSGLPTTSPSDGHSLVRLAHELDPGAPRLHPSSRLDAEVTGVVVFARTTQAIEHLLAARASGSYSRGYLALTAAAPTPRSGEWRAAIAVDPRDPRKRSAVREDAADARVAHTLYRTLAEGPKRAALWLEPQTGRTHQLRVHAAHAGTPLLGDRHYGGAARVVLEDGSVVALRRTMLHCARVSVPVPGGGHALRFEAAPPLDLLAAWSALGGAPFELP
jgi:23S rRNA pseudouridine1911/1915/1917 synthase